MSVLIRGMEMPKKVLTVEIHPDGYVCLQNGNKVGEAIPVQPHGRLIDADALDMNYLHIRDDGMKIYTQRAIDNAPTIIPTEEVKK